MRILITGGRGQLGRAVEAALGEEEVWPLSHAELDVTDAGQVRDVLKHLRPNCVIHAAAWTDTAGCEGDPARAMLENGEAPGIVADACNDIGATVIYISSNEVFDGEKQTPYVEEDEPRPINVYGRSKWEGELRVRAALERQCIVRTSWL